MKIFIFILILIVAGPAAFYLTRFQIQGTFRTGPYSTWPLKRRRQRPTDDDRTTP